MRIRCICFSGDIRKISVFWLNQLAYLELWQKRFGLHESVNAIAAQC